MKAPVVALKQPGNHGPHAGSICKKICPQRPQPGKYDYFEQPESYSRSGAWEFFTEDGVLAKSRGAEALNVLASPMLNGSASNVAASARKADLPAMCQWREMAEAGCLISYGPSFMEG